MSYFGGIRLFCVPKSYPFLRSEITCSYFLCGGGGTKIFEIFLGKELTLHVTMFCDKYPAFTLHYTNMTLLRPVFL